MKTMKCKELGGACDEEFQAETFEEIAEQLAISPNTVKSRLYSALGKMKAPLEVIRVES